MRMQEASAALAGGSARDVEREGSIQIVADWNCARKNSKCVKASS